MTVRTDMLTTLGNAPHLLGKAASRVVTFLKSRYHTQGGFCGRSDHADLYYSLFALEALRALNAPVDHNDMQTYLTGFSDGHNLDLVHLSCLIRCWANLSEQTDTPLQTSLHSQLLHQLKSRACPDHGFHTCADAEQGSAYGIFLALGAFQDLHIPAPAESLLNSLFSLQRPDGSFANDHGTPQGSTPATAAALCVLCDLSNTSQKKTILWLLDQAQPSGGFTVAPPISGLSIPPDLLSTATALFALARTGTNLSSLREITLDFCNDLWHPEGAFAGHYLDPTLDCEYTYYGLLALGVLNGT